MPEPASSPAERRVWYSYAIIRVVPRVDRGECLNVGIILFARTIDYLQARFVLDTVRLAALAPWLDQVSLVRHLVSFSTICAGGPDGGPVGLLPPSERFHWLTAPRSTVLQTSPVHVGTTADPDAELEALLDAFVRPPTDRDEPDDGE